MGMSLPIVVISPSTRRRGAEFHDFSIDLSNQYLLAIEAAGAIPMVLPCLSDPQMVAEAVRHAHGVLLTGGDDVETTLYRKGLPPELARTVSPPARERDLFELMLIDEVFRQKKPLLAICRGQQM